jgi:hypothetical protein
MQPQGTSVVNASFIDNATARVNALTTAVGTDGAELAKNSAALCAELNHLMSTVMADVQAEITAIKAKIAELLPIITLPHDLGSALTWISNFAAPQIAAYNKLQAQLTAMLAAISGLVAAITTAAGKLLSCNVSIPAIV